MDLVALIGSLVGILTFVFSAFHYVVLKPLKETIIELKNLITKLQDNIDIEKAKRHEHELKINTLEQELQYFKEKLELVFEAYVKSAQTKKVKG